MKTRQIIARLQTESAGAIEKPRRRQSAPYPTDRECGQQRPTGARILIQQQLQQTRDAVNSVRRLEPHAVGDLEIAQRSSLSPGLFHHRAKSLEFIAVRIGSGIAQRPQLFFSSTRSAR